MSIPVPVIKLSSASKTSFSNPSETNQYKFSSYVDETEETFVLQLGSMDFPSLTSSDRRLIFPSGNSNQTKESSEIGVFDAEKYFNEGLNLNQNSSPKLVRKSLLPPHQPRETSENKEKQPRTATPSVVSESSSHNSRSVLLLHNATRTSQPKKTIKKSFLAIIGCNPSCCDRFSVVTSDEPSKKSCAVSTEEGIISIQGGRQRQVDYNNDHPSARRSSNSDFSCLKKFDQQAAGLRVNSNDHFSFPVFSVGNNQTTKKYVKKNKTDMPKQRPLQVFGSPVMENGNMISCYCPEKNNNRAASSLPPWDAIPKALLQEIDTLENGSDEDSDASSDLFEIESFSKSNHFLSRQASSDNGTACCYAPSEASVEWSVVTASAADFSALSDSEELKSNSISTIPRNKEKSFVSRPKIAAGSIDDDQSSIKRRSGTLSGCIKSHKAVGIVENVHKMNGNNANGFSNVTTRRCDMPESHTQMTTETKVAGFVARNRQRSFDACMG